MSRGQLTEKYLDNLGYPYDDSCVNYIVRSWESDHEEQLMEEDGFEIDEEDVRDYWLSYVAENLFIQGTIRKNHKKRWKL